MRGAATGTPDLIVLHRPWGLLGPSQNRQELRAPGKVESDGLMAPLLFSRDERAVLIDGNGRNGERFVDLRTRLDETQQLWELPLPLDGRNAQTLRFHGWDGDATIEYSLPIRRPPTEAAPEGATDRSSRLLRSLQTIAARMEDFRSALARQQDPWRHVQELWLNPTHTRDPTKDVIVRHAEEHGRLWEDIAEHPRRLLNRSRELVTLSGVQELDTQCMRWLSRQPGRSLAERAGPRQRILAVARRENRDTLENRVFRDLMVRSVAAAGDYLDAVQPHRGAEKQHLVRRYRRACRSLEARLVEQGVSRQIEAAQPNYVLVHDARYRLVWQARQELIRRERALDDLWRWQHRCWAEFCKAVVAAGLLWAHDAECGFASPLVVADEHHRGQWLVHDDPMIVIAEQRTVVELLSGNSRDLPSNLRELGASFWLRRADMEGGDFRYLAVWAVHGLDELDLPELVASAEKALRCFPERQRPAGGLVLASTVEKEREVRPVRAEIVSGMAFSPYDHPLAAALGHLPEILPAQIECLAASTVARGCLEAARRGREGQPIYFDFLPQLQINALVEGRPQFVDLIASGERCQGGQVFRAPAPDRYAVNPGASQFAFWLFMEDREHGRKAEVPLPETADRHYALTVEVSQTPGQGFAEVTISSPEFDALRRSPIRLNWAKMQEIFETREHILEEMGRQSGGLAWPETAVLRGHPEHWSETHWRDSLLALLAAYRREPLVRDGAIHEPT